MKFFKEGQYYLIETDGFYKVILIRFSNFYTSNYQIVWSSDDDCSKLIIIMLK